MVDIHSHILPGIDDGAQNFEESMEMLSLAAASGTTDIVATPHANSNYVFDAAKVERLIAELSAEADGRIKIHRGCDFHLNFDNLLDAVKNPARYTVNGGRYLMLELPDLVSLAAMRPALGRLLDARIVPIITHPERNPSLQARIKDLEQWVQDGCLVQITGQSLTGRFGVSAQRSCETLFNADMVHFVASDAHDVKDRPPDLSAPYKLVATRWGSEQADILFIHNPTAVIWNEPIYASPPKRSKGFSIFSFWK